MINLEFIKRRRIQLDLNIDEMADLLGYSNGSNYYKYEAGIYKFKADILPRLASVLKTDIEDFFCDENAETEIKNDNISKTEKAKQSM